MCCSAMLRASSSGRALRVAWAMSSPPCRALINVSANSAGSASAASSPLSRMASNPSDKYDCHSLIAKHKLRFPVGHSADAVKIAAATGAYVNDEPHYLQSTGFVLAPDGTVRVAVYSSDAIGRLVADDVAGYIRYLAEHAA
jgi:hypothetical protein